MSVTFTPRSADRISRITQWAEKTIGTERGDSGQALPADAVYVLTTSGTATSGLYPGKVVLYDANANVWREYGTVKLKPANSETLTDATRYAARHSGKTSGGDDVFTVLQGGGGLTVAELDGTPSYTGITQIQFDQADGFIVSQPLTGIARIDMYRATETIEGIVSTTGQTFAGVKTFNDGIIYEYNSTFYGASTPVGKLYCSTKITNNRIGFFHISQGDTADRYFVGSRGAVSTPGSTYDRYDCGFEFVSTSYYGEVVLSARKFASNLSGSIVNVYSENPILKVKYGGNELTGQTGTLKSNATVTCGIVTNLGTTSVQSSSWMGF